MENAGKAARVCGFSGATLSRQIKIKRSSGHRPEGDNLAPGLELVQVVGPGLHHLFTFRQMGGPVVGPAQGIADSVSELVLYQFGPEPHNLVKDRSRHGLESMPG